MKRIVNMMASCAIGAAFGSCGVLSATSVLDGFYRRLVGTALALLIVETFINNQSK